MSLYNKWCTDKIQKVKKKKAKILNAVPIPYSYFFLELRNGLQIYRF